MRKSVILLSLFVFSLIATSAQAQNNMYFSGTVGLTVQEDMNNDRGAQGIMEIDTDTGINGGGAIGLRLNQFRVEGEIAIRDSDVSKANPPFGGTGGIVGASRALSFLGGVYYDIPYSPLVKPYFGVAAGLAKVSLEAIEPNATRFVDDSDWEPAYKIGAGIAYTVTPRIEVVFDYHYFATLDPDYTDNFGNDFQSEFKSHNLNLGFRYNF
jgi:OOP family OmpA-OmpF porin